MTEASTRWVPLEGNPDVMNGWSRKVGLVLSQDSFTDIYGLDEELLGIVPQPVKAVVLLFPLTEKSEAERKEEDRKTEEGSLPTIDSDVIWIKQTINNACGTIGLLHALMNTRVTLVPESPLAKFIEECKDQTPLRRAELLETTPLFADIHAEEASVGQSAIPVNLHTDYHFTCFVEARCVGKEGRRLVELDGRRVGPIDRGPCVDILKDVATFVKERFVLHSDGVNLNMIALSAV
ncbi:hypothetical protein M0805_001869 [Coniferiporia weirii]|nr:hypothetical protein M0805_001869 [Coniferiporia weirii]